MSLSTNGLEHFPCVFWPFRVSPSQAAWLSFSYSAIGCLSFYYWFWDVLYVFWRLILYRLCCKYILPGCGNFVYDMNALPFNAGKIINPFLSACTFRILFMKSIEMFFCTFSMGGEKLPCKFLISCCEFFVRWICKVRTVLDRGWWSFCLSREDLAMSADICVVF